LGPSGRRDERQVDRRLLHGRELDLGLLGGLLEALERHRVLAEVDALLLAELLGEEVDEDWSQSSPPRCVSPLVLSTSKTPSPMSRIDTSNVPPPRSKTAIFSFFFLSRP
jgi:hypothetical protein